MLDDPGWHHHHLQQTRPQLQAIVSFRLLSGSHLSYAKVPVRRKAPTGRSRVAHPTGPAGGAQDCPRVPSEEGPIQQHDGALSPLRVEQPRLLLAEGEFSEDVLRRSGVQKPGASRDIRHSAEEVGGALTEPRVNSSTGVHGEMLAVQG
ncbi:hypothetical protein NDU88_002082 [Pleurodeles waltl]|uniref:Uncharacterized protein n=1 Tax=Pleurodeles waltl TaxID=8319 RepID=A0AAV7KUK7_PLEWA|nr:hypothetical protein NDU88_002082 [Pleurodeles waltl]